MNSVFFGGFWFISLFFLLEDQLSSTSVAVELPCSDYIQEHQKEGKTFSNPSSKKGSVQSLKGSRADITSSNVDTRMFSLSAPHPREPDSRVMSRCSTLPSKYRGAEACYSLPRPSLSTSLTKLQQQGMLTPLVPLACSQSTSNQSSPLLTPVLPSSPKPRVSQQPQASTELFVLKGPPPQLPRSRGKTRCSTLPPRQRAPDTEEPTRPSHSTSCTKLEDIPPSSSELKHKNTRVWGELETKRQRAAEGGGGLSRLASHVWVCISPAVLFTCIYYKERPFWFKLVFLFCLFLNRYIIFILSIV